MDIPCYSLQNIPNISDDIERLGVYDMAQIRVLNKLRAMSKKEFKKSYGKLQDMMNQELMEAHREKSDYMMRKEENAGEGYFDKKLKELEEKQAKYEKDVANRDYLVRTKFLGTLKNKKLIKDFKNEFGSTERSFEAIKEAIINFEFDHIDMEKVMDILAIYKTIQDNLDTYAEKPKPEKKKETKSNTKNGK